MSLSRPLLSTALLSAALAASSSAASDELLPARQFATKGPVSHVALGDFDGDGALDALATSFFGLNALRGDGHGALGAYALIHAGATSPTKVTLAPLDAVAGDEVLVADSSPPRVIVLHDGGAGTLVISTTMPLAAAASDLLTGDADGDGDADVIAVAANGSGCVLARNTGAGAFLPATAIAGTAGALGAALGDLDGDGALDLVLARANGIATLAGTGSGAFGTPQAMALREGTDTVALGDLDGNGTLDAVCARSGQDTLHALLGDGEGQLVPAQTLAGHGNVFALALLDLSQDGRADLVLNTGDELLIFQADGTGTLLAPHALDIGTSFECALGDLDGDLRPDLVVPAFAADALTVLRAVGKGQFEAPVATALPFGSYDELVATDMDGDGDPDAVLIDLEFSRVVTWLDEDGVFVQGASVHDGFPQEVAAGDLDGDGDADIVITFHNGSDAHVWTNAGGSFTGPVAHALGLFAGSPVLADVNEDGALDLLAIGGSGPSLLVARGTGAGGFLPTVAAASVPQTSRLVLGDVTGDGHADAVLAGVSFSGGQAGLLRALAGDGDGGFASLGQASGGLLLTDVALADLDRDGDLDAAACQHEDFTPSSGPLVVFTNDGAGHFAATAELPVHARSLASGDMDGDGFTDLVAGESFSGSATLLRATAPGQLTITSHEAG
ncbi:MAG TPA: VCBS repeat-containing protein, partial [Planctomycetota bacterium]|nr:VCBS repeat-containing protein [Planctomycetota bacterium]